jgi:hypothetical protein
MAEKVIDYGRPEVLDIAYSLIRTVEEELCDSGVIRTNPEWLALAEKARLALFALYQSIGKAYFAGE